ncbi:MAG TPA: WD40 repeat domain-containing protein, partial [Gemmataceae bacterium]|nr:WD40 repeat domain-containing protein [Gemmataceae bacterium]
MGQIRAWMLGLTVLLSADIGPAQPGGPKAEPIVDAHGDPLPPGASLRLGSVAFRHRFAMPWFAYAPDGKTIAATDGDHLTIWDIATEKIVRTLTVPRADPDSQWYFSRVAYSPDGTLLVASVGIWPYEAKWSKDGRLFVFDAASGRFLRDFERARVLGFCFCGDNKTIAIAEANDAGSSRITLWDAATGNKTSESAPLADTEFGSIAFLSQAKQFVTSEKGGNLRFWKMAGLVMDGPPTKTDCSGAAVSLDGKLVAEIDPDTVKRFEKRVTVRDAKTRETIVNLKDARFVHEVAFSPDSALLAAACQGEIVVWERATWRKRNVFHTTDGGWVDVRFSPDSKTLASTNSTDRVLRFWDLQSGKRVHRMAGHENYIHALAFSPGGERLCSAAPDFTTRIWDPKTGNEIRVHERGSHVDEDGDDVGIAWSPDGSLLSSGLQIYGAKDGKPLRLLSGNLAPEKGGPFRRAAFSTDSRFLAASFSELSWWDARSGKRLDSIPTPTLTDEFVVTPDGTRAITLDRDKRVVLWDLVAKRRLHETRLLREQLGWASGRLAISPDGKRFALGGVSVGIGDIAEPGRFRIFGADPSPLTTPVDMRKFIQSLAFAPQGKMIAIGRGDESVSLWDLASQREIMKFSTAQGSVDSLAFSPDGRWIATGGSNSTVLLWRLRDLLAADADKTDVAASWA